MARYFVWVSIVFLAVAGGGNRYLPLDRETVAIVNGILFFAFFSFALARWKDSGDGRAGLSRLTAALILFFAWNVLGYFYTARAVSMSLLAAQYAGTVLLVLGLVLYLRDEGRVREIFWALVPCADAAVLFGLYQQWRPAILKTDPAFYRLSVSSFFLHPNFFPTYLIFFVPIAVRLYQSENARALKILAGASFALILAGVGISGSPSGQMVAAAQTAIMGWYFWRDKRTAEVKTVAAGAVLAFVCYAGWAYFLHTRWTPPGFPEGQAPFSLAMRPWIFGDLMNRFLLWQVAWEIFKDHWLTGSGPWTFVALYLEYEPRVASGIRLMNFPDGNPYHAHNLFVQTASDTGLIGLTLFLCALFLFYKKTLALVHDRNQPYRDPVFFIAVGISGYLAHNLVEYNFAPPAFHNSLVLLMLLADFYFRKTAAGPRPACRWTRWARLGWRMSAIEGNPGLGHSLRGDPRPAVLSGPRTFLISASALAAVCALVLTHSYLYDREMHLAKHKSKNLEEAELHVQRAKFLCPVCEDPYLFMAVQALSNFKLENNPQFLKRAEEEAQGALRLTDHCPEALLVLGDVRIFQGRLPEARQFYRRALKLGPMKKAALQGLKIVDGLEKEKKSTESGEP
ncbi:MAG: O-antigen ligase family protein [Nitrospinae bacterium]|nr:O-antigen ligase family protein [Nitrospinota bacterium]